jgi:Rieske Fe-S protein
MAQLSRNVFKAILICFFLLSGINGCKDDYTSIIPNVTVNFNVNTASYIELNVPGGSVVFPNVGYGGVIVFRDLTDNSSNPFLAFDATCTKEVSSTVKVVADESGIATCPKCGSQFILFGGNGSPIKGPATEPLKQYRTTYSGGLINVRN